MSKIAPNEQPNDVTRVSADAPEIAALRRTIAGLTLQVAEQAARLVDVVGPVEWLALQALSVADRGGYHTETIRTWCVAQLIEAYRDRKRWIVNRRSLNCHLAKLGLDRNIALSR
jgi:hypothetical protein